MTKDDLIAATIAGSEFITALKNVLRCELIGSAAYLPAEQVNDIDYALLVPPIIDGVNGVIAFSAGLLYDDGFKPCGEYDTSGANEWTAVRRGDINIMVTSNEPWFSRYVAAMQVCKYLKIEDKAQRIAICKIVRDGLTADDVALGGLF